MYGEQAVPITFFVYYTYLTFCLSGLLVMCDFCQIKVVIMLPPSMIRLSQYTIGLLLISLLHCS